MLKKLKRNYDWIIIATLTFIILLFIIIPFFRYNSLDKFDTPGLLALSKFIRDYRLPDFSGWNPFYYAGFPQGTLYPPLFHYLVAVLGKAFSIQTSYKLVVSIVSILIPFSIHKLSKSLYKSSSWSLLSSFFILITLILLPGYMGFNFDSILDYGLGPSFMTIPFFFYYLGELFKNKINIYKLSISFSLMILTNLVAPLVAVLVTASWIIFNRKNSTGLKRVFASGILVSFITAFWAIPFLYFHKFTASGFAAPSNLVFSLIAIILVLIVGIFLVIKKQKRYYPFLLISLLISLLNLADAFLNIRNTTFSTGPVHLFRLQIFSIILVVISATSFIQLLHPFMLKAVSKINARKFFKRTSHLIMNFLLLFISFTALIIFRLNPKGIEALEVNPNFNYEGRAMRVYKVSEVLDQSRAVIDKSVSNENFATMGLLKESSYLAPYLQSLAKSIDTENFTWNELDNYYLENKQIPKEKADYLMNLLWVKHLFTITKEQNKCENYKLIDKFETNSLNEGKIEREMYICDYTPSLDSSFLKVIKSPVSRIHEKWDKKLENWWFSENTNLFSNQSLPIETSSVTPSDLEYDFSSDYQTLTIKNISEEKATVLIKMSYFPNWRAYNNSDREVELYRVSPNLMALNINREVTLKYSRSITEYIAILTTISGIPFIIILESTRIKKTFYSNI